MPTSPPPKTPVRSAELPYANIAHVTPSQSAQASGALEGELIATAVWPRWPGAFLLGVPVLIAGYAFGIGGATVGGFLAGSEEFGRGILELAADHYALGLAVLLVVAGFCIGIYAGVASLLNTSRVFLTQDRLIVTTSPVPLFRRRRSYALCDIISVSARKHGNLDRQYDYFDSLVNWQYALVVRLRGKEPKTALWNLGEKKQAMRVARAINDRIDNAGPKRAAPGGQR